MLNTYQSASTPKNSLSDGLAHRTSNQYCPIVNPKLFEASSKSYKYPRGARFRVQYASVYQTPGDILQNHLSATSVIAR
jgi:hypothetical protein